MQLCQFANLISLVNRYIWRFYLNVLFSHHKLNLQFLNDVILNCCLANQPEGINPQIQNNQRQRYQHQQPHSNQPAPERADLEEQNSDW